MSPVTSRFVLLRHELPADSSRPSHWDLLLEHEGKALTWALTKLPQVWDPESLGDEVLATRLPDHRLMYFDYEGSVSGDRGEVARVLAGTCQWRQLGEGRVEAVLACDDGKVQLSLDDTGSGGQWRLWARRPTA